MASSAAVGLLTHTPAATTNGYDIMTAHEPIDWSLPAADIRELLLADVWVPTNAAITVAEIVDAVGKDAASLVIGTLQSGASLGSATGGSVSSAYGVNTNTGTVTTANGGHA